MWNKFLTCRCSVPVLLLFLPLVSCCAPLARGAQSASIAHPNQTLPQKIGATKDLLDINTATTEQLKALPGMGQAYAQRVIDGRPYSAKNQLTTRGILPADEYERIRPLIVAHRVKLGGAK